MKEIDDNLKARLADYINGKTGAVTDEEVQLMADNDALAAEVIEIADIALEAEKISAFGESTRKQGKGTTIRLVILAAAACIILGIGMGLVFQNHSGNTVAPSQGALAEASGLSKGYQSLPEDIEKLMESASVGNSFDYPPCQPFDIVLPKPCNGDTLVLCNAQNQQLLKTKVNDNYAPIEGLASGLYYYYLIYNPTIKGVLSVGEDEYPQIP